MVSFEVTIAHSCEGCDNPVHAGDQYGPLVSFLETAVVWVAVAVKPGPRHVVAVRLPWIVRALILTTQEDPETAKNIDTGEHQNENDDC